MTIEKRLKVLFDLGIQIKQGSNHDGQHKDFWCRFISADSEFDLSADFSSAVDSNAEEAFELAFQKLIDHYRQTAQFFAVHAEKAQNRLAVLQAAKNADF